MTVTEALEQMVQAMSPACRAKTAPYIAALADKFDQQERMILHLATRPRVLIDLTAAPAGLKLSDD